ncbi:complement C5-like isoform X2 [Ranitomeya variabilis]|uniref:complement C5-like isoform X2 n=1 Tax=Ranitomeya variabilis TaxID=490064 RepID=UPI004056720B
MLLLCIAVLLTLYGRGFSQEQTYLVMGPRMWRVGAQETVLIQAFGYKENLLITISLLSYPDKQKTFSTESLELNSDNNYQGRVTLRIRPNDFPRKDGATQFVCLRAHTSSFTKEERVPVSHHNGFLFIQSDKPVYTPDQSVKVRIYSMDEELRPARRAVTVTFKDPDEVKMDVITQQDATGIISFPDFKIPANPKFGTWKIEAAYSADYTTSTMAAFDVKEYVLPRFFVTIVPSQNFISYDTFDAFTITVKANYYYGKKLEQAKVFIRYGIIKGGERRMMTKSIDVLTMIGGEAVFQFKSRRAVDELGFSQLEELDGSYLYMTTSVEETAGSQSEESENADVRYVITPYTLKLIGTPLYVKPTLPYYVKVQVKDTLDKAVPKIRLSLTGEMVQDDGEVSPLSSYHSQIQMTDGKGIAEFVVNIPADVTILEFTIKTADKNLQDENQASSTYTATAYKSPTKSYLYINWARESEVLHVGGYLNVQVVPKSPYMAKLTHYSYLVISKGKIVTYNTVQRVHDSTSQNLNIQITAAMVPSIRLLVYYIITGDSTAEVVADSIWVDVREKCINNQEVQLSTKKRVFQPKASVPLTVQAQTGSIVALSAVDVSVYDVTKKTQRPMDRVLRRIEESDLGCGAGAGKDNKEVFELAGLTFITNANIRASQTTAFSCNEIIRSKRSDTLGAEILKAISTYKDKRLRQCCEAGGRAFTEDHQCVAGIARIQKDKGQPCVSAFTACCEVVQAKDHELAQKNLDIGRMFIRTVFDLDEPEIRSYFPESWLWEELSISDRRGFKEAGLTLPDSLTTWEIQGIGMSDQGLCVADPAQITVSKDLFIDVQLPYSVIRGEQVEIQVTVYNYQNSKVKGCISVSVGKEVCLVSELKIGHRGKAKDCNEEFKPEMPRVFTYNILPLALGLHTINFTLNAQFNGEKVVKMLRVVSEGIKMEQSVGFTLDPLGLRGVTKRQQDLPYRIPANTVPKSGINRIFSINGNIMGEVIDSVLNSDGVKYLVSMPKGNAEMELARVAPIFYVYHYLETKQQWSLLEANTLSAQLDMKQKLKEGVRSVLAFRNRDYSYSLWRDSQPSTWMTAFALRIFGDVHRYVAIDQMSVCTTLLWLVDNCQAQDGSFQEKSTSSPVKLQGTIPREASEKTLYLTAYTVIAIQKAFHMCPVIKVENKLNLAIYYLSRHASNAQSTFTLAVTAYALAISEATLQSKSYTLGKLKSEAYSKGVGSPVYRYWKDTLKKFDMTEPSAETAKMVETTAYALLTILKTADKEYAKPVLRWLKEQQRYGGGFFSTQDTIIALEALTEVAILDEKLTLNMDVKVSYRKSGDFQNYRLTEQQPFTRPVEVPILEDLTVSTRSVRGIATGSVQTVFHIITPQQDKCKFDLRIQKKDPSQSIFDDDTSQMLLLEVCARYKPQKDEISTSGQAVMEITLLTGLQADEKQLNKLKDRVDQFVTDYSIEDGKVILYFDWISDDDYVCAPLYVRNIFKVSFRSPGIFKVYEFHAPEQECTMYYNPHLDDNLQRVCFGDNCKCIEGECPKTKDRLDSTTTADQRREAACKPDMTYAYKVKVISSEEEGDFLKYTVTIVDVFNKGSASVKADKQVWLIKKKTCEAFILQSGEQYLIMGKDGLQIRGEREYQYEYPLDSSVWVEWWPELSSCRDPSCGHFISILDEFSENFLLEGCQS